MGILSVVPPLIAIFLAIVTRRVIISLFISIWVGGIIYTGGDPFSGLGYTFTWMKDVMIDDWNARFLVLTALLGVGAAFMYKTGGSEGLIRLLEDKLTTKRRVLFLPYILGILVFFNDYANSVIVGNASKDITGKNKVSREKLAYVLDATSAPMATIGPVSDWIGYQVSIIAGAFAAVSITGIEPYYAFLQSIPWNFYSILSLAAVGMFIVMGRDFGPMAKAEHRAETTGELIEKGATPLSSVEEDLGQPFKKDGGSVWFFILPLVTLVAVGIWGLWYTGGGAEGKTMIEALADTDVAEALTWAAFAMTFVGVVIALFQRVGFKELEETVLAGITTMLPAILIIILAWSIGVVTDELGTAEYVVGATESWMTPMLMPLLIFIIGMFISFATGTSWGTMAILTPIAIPLAYTIGGEDLIPLAIGAIFSGAIFGDHVSPISDTTIMASIFAGSDHIAHVKTQMPYAIVTAVISGAMFLLYNVISNVYILLVIALVLQFLVLQFLTRRHSRKYPELSNDSS